MRKTLLYRILKGVYGEFPKAETYWDIVFQRPVLGTYLYASYIS